MLINNLSEKLIEETDFSIVDVETTGLSPDFFRIIEIGVVKVVQGKIVDKYESFVNPLQNIPYFITSLTGIKNKDVENAPTFKEIADDLLKFMEGNILTAHNLSFDSKFLKAEFDRAERELLNPGLCTLKLARRLYPFLKSKSLGSVCLHLNIKNKNSHRALADAEATAHALIKMQYELKKNYNIIYLPELLAFQQITKRKEDVIIKNKALVKDIVELPDAPGIYYYMNAKKDIIYIGKAKSLSERIKSYFSSSASYKAKKITSMARSLKFEITNSELTAFLYEAELIKTYMPRLNRQLKKYGNKYFLRIKNESLFPVIEVCNTFDFDGNDYFGLFISRRNANVLSDIIKKTFAIRECSDKEFAKGKGCFLEQIERCTAPCLNNDRNSYLDELQKVYDFLNGEKQTALDRLLNKMKDYSQNLAYEKAAEIKEIIDLILSQIHKSSLLSEPINSAKVLFEVNDRFGRDYVLMISGKVYVKKYIVKDKDDFDIALTDYFENAIQTNFFPTDEDLEKMKITLNWVVRNRNKVKIYYLKDYQTKEQLYSNVSFNKFKHSSYKNEYDIKELSLLP